MWKPLRNFLNRKFYQKVMKHGRSQKDCQKIQHFLHLGLTEAQSEQTIPGNYVDSLSDWVIGTEAQSFLSYEHFLKIVQSEEIKTLFLR